jgi:hypothetical protein
MDDAALVPLEALPPLLAMASMLRNSLARDTVLLT